VVIVSHNEGERLRETVDSFLANTPELTEIVVVDDASSDGSADFLGPRGPGGYEAVRLLRMEASAGISAARNAGGRACRSPVIVWSDAHCAVDPGWAAPLIEALADPTVGEVAPAVGYLDGKPGQGYGFTWKDPSMKMKWLERPDGPADVPFICGCFLAMRRDVFELSGGFDEGMYRWGSEDAELSLRLWLAGYRCQVVPQSQAAHLFRKRFPYEVDWSGVIYNALRMAVVHLPEASVEKVLGHYHTRAAFGRAWARLVASDTWERREAVAAGRTRDPGAWLREMDVTGVL
jgi:GT2 family glycosyltransferase